MGLRDFAKIFRRSWYIILGVTLLGGAVGAGIAAITTPVYKATTSLYVSVRTDGTATGGDLVQGSAYARQIVQSWAEVTNTAIVLDQVISDLKLDVPRADLAKSIDASTPANTVGIQITASDPDPKQAARIANATAKSLSDVVSNTLERPQSVDEKSLVRLTVTQPAEVPTEPSIPNWVLNITAGIIAGLALGLGIAVLRQLFDTRLRTAEDLEHTIDVAVLGSIPRDPEVSKRRLIVQADPRNPRAEPFRALRTNLQFLNAEEGPRSFVISSPGPGEGKSTLTANLALSIAETGARIALVDGDLRIPRIADYLGLEGGVGLTDVLIGRVGLADALQRCGSGDLFVLPAGPVPPNPSELLGSTMMDNVLAALTEHFDYVLVDSPPVLLVTDAAVVGKKTRGVILVAASGKTRKPAIVSAVRAVRDAGANVLGVAITMVSGKAADAYGYGATKTPYGDQPVSAEHAEATRAALREARRNAAATTKAP